MIFDQTRLWIVGVALASLSFFCAKPIRAQTSSRGQLLTFPGGGLVKSGTLITDDTTGVTYYAELVADRDVKGRPIVVDLTLRRAGSPHKGRNLVEPPGRWHGLEPFSIAARDVKSGTPSIWGLHRQIPIQGSRAALLMDIKNVQLSGCSSRTECAFSSITVVITITQEVFQKS